MGVNSRHQRPASRGVLMVDVARLAGVSQKTVSRVVNKAPYVRPDVRDKVNEAIAELGYRPNVAAQALARERTHTIGVLALGTALLGPSRRVFTLEQAARELVSSRAPSPRRRGGSAASLCSRRTTSRSRVRWIKYQFRGCRPMLPVASRC